MKKRIYRRMPVNDFQLDSISHADLRGKLLFAIDVAKVDMVAAIATADGRVLQTLCCPTRCQNAASSRQRWPSRIFTRSATCSLCIV